MMVNENVNKDFTNRYSFHEVILPGILVLMEISKKDPQQTSIMYLTILLLFNISASKWVANNLNEPFNLNILQNGKYYNEDDYSYADIVFIQVIDLIKNGPRLLKPRYSWLISILSNLSPYVKSLCKESCTGLMYLMQVFSKEEFLLENVNHCSVLSILLDTINNLIAFNSQSNHHLKIQLVKHRILFYQFQNNCMGKQPQPNTIYEAVLRAGPEMTDQTPDNIGSDDEV